MARDSSWQMGTWLSELYHHPERPPARQRDVLTCVAVHFMDWSTGRGWASIAEIAQFAKASRSTVQRALRWGRNSLLVIRTRRGHRVGNGDTIKSHWCLQVSPELLRTVITVRGPPVPARRAAAFPGLLKASIPQLLSRSGQGVRTALYGVLKASEPCSSRRQPAASKHHT